MSAAPLLVFAWGNPSRGDDALGPELARRLELSRADLVASGQLEVLTDFQLQVEHALDLVGRERVFFVDATASGDQPFTVTRVTPSRDDTFTSHVLSPAALLHTFETVTCEPVPECWVVAIRGSDFELGAPMSAQASANLSSALADLASRLGP